MPGEKIICVIRVLSVLKIYYRFIKVSGSYGIASPYPAILYGRGDLRNTLCLNGHAGRQKPPEKVKNYVELPRSHGMTVSHQREPGRVLEQDGSSEQWEETSNATLQALLGSNSLQFLSSYGFQLLGFRFLGVFGASGSPGCIPRDSYCFFQLSRRARLG